MQYVGAGVEGRRNQERCAIIIMLILILIVVVVVVER